VQDAIDKGAFRTRGTAQEGSPNMVNIMRTATEIAGAMTYLHSLDILHSDLNGNNILLMSNTGIDDRPFSIKVRLPSPILESTTTLQC
jgi:serine/threonine protein kinase